MYLGTVQKFRWWKIEVYRRNRRKKGYVIQNHSIKKYGEWAELTRNLS